MAAVDGDTAACLTRMAEKAIVNAPAIAIARGRAARALTTAGVARTVLGANPLGHSRQAPRRARPRAQRAAPPQGRPGRPPPPQAAAPRFGRRRPARPPSVPVTAPRRLIFRVPLAVPLTCTVPEIAPLLEASE